MRYDILSDTASFPAGISANMADVWDVIPGFGCKTNQARLKLDSALASDIGR
jgi:hypothetical protein